MAGTLTIDTLKASSGVLATQNGMTGIAKAWVQFAGSTGTIAGSFNVSSIARSATGRYVVNFTTAMPNINYAVACSASNYVNAADSGTFINYYESSASGYVAPTTSSFVFSTLTYNQAAYQDPTLVTAIVNGA